MPRVYDTDAFSARVNYAATVIARAGANTRTFDTCFEMWDGDAVAVAVYRRARKNPKLRANLWRYIGRKSVIPLAWSQRRRPTKALAAWAREIRAEAKRRNDEWMNKINQEDE